MIEYNKYVIKKERGIKLKINEEKIINEIENTIRIDEKIVEEYSNVDGDIDDYIFAWQPGKYVSER